MKKLLFACILMLCAIGCGKRHNPLVDRAEKQLPASMKEYLGEEYPNYRDLRLDSIKLVYDDDSICLFQCRAFLVKENNDSVFQDYRYVYLFNVEMSDMEQKMIFNDGIYPFDLYTDKRIEEGRQIVKEEEQSVYINQYGLTHPVKHPVEPYKRPEK